jgi:pimeloyl-ACP methyl ester carboxylesterase
MSEIRPFTCRAPESALSQLRQRLSTARWPERETVRDWSQGVPLDKLRALVDYWRDAYDWRRFEQVLEAVPQYCTSIDGLAFHFLHVPSAHPNALPLLLTHGWPGSVIEFLKVIPPLTNPPAYGADDRDAFHIIAPSLPGFGFSAKPSTTGWTTVKIAAAWAELMRRLGYRQYVASGGDWGAHVTTRLAQQHPRGLMAIHLTMPLVIPDPLPANSGIPEEQAALTQLQHLQSDEFGFYHMQSTRPQTIGYALADSAVGQAAWIYEKFRAFSDNDGDPESALTTDDMLNVITFYWLTNSAASSARMYFENASVTGNDGIVDIPVACTIFPREPRPAPRT